MDTIRHYHILPAPPNYVHGQEPYQDETGEWQISRTWLEKRGVILQRNTHIDIILQELHNWLNEAEIEF
jgi:hypothetical protein